MVKKNNRIPVEQEHQKKAFELYYALGKKRMHRRVADQVGVSASTIKLWSRSFDWRRRISERDAATARKVADRAIQASTNDRPQNQKIVQLALMRLAKAIADGKVRMQLSDLERLLRLQAGLVDGRFVPHPGRDATRGPGSPAYSDGSLLQFTPAELQEANRALIKQLRDLMGKDKHPESEKQSGSEKGQ